MAPDGTPPTLDGRLEKWRAAEQSATEGPWEAHSHAAGPCCDIRVHDIWQDEQDAYIAQDCLTEADAGFIVEARTAMPLLLGAVERLLEDHQPGRAVILGRLCRRHADYRYFSITSTEADGVRACPDCTATVYSACTGCGPQVSADACPVRATIGRGLAGKDGSDEQ